jgi:capsule polysaccharide export protein KpsC/LpsZ
MSKKKIIGVEAPLEDYSPVVYKSLMRVIKKGNMSCKLFRIRKKNKARRARFNKFTLYSADHVKKLDLLVVFSPYATSHNAIKICRKSRTPLLYLESGFLPKSVLCDIKGFWGDSDLCSNMGNELKKISNDKCLKWSNKYRKYLISNNSSKRKQPDDHPKINEPFVFLPMQYMDDQSVLRFGNVPYGRFMKLVARFCHENKIRLIVKKHPHAYRKEKKSVNNLIKILSKKFKNTITVSDGSIHWFCQNCIFMAGMNTGAIVDGLINKTITTHCGQSIFMNSGAVIHDDDVERGLGRALEISKDRSQFDKIEMCQSKLLYYLYNHYLLLEDEPFSSAKTNEEKIRNQIDKVI